MIRRRRSTDIVVFEVGESTTSDESDEPGGDTGPDGAALAVATPTGHRTRAQARRQAIAAGTVLVVALAGWGVTDAARAREHDERIAAAPGGVLSLEQPPVEAWSAPTDGAGEWLVLPGIVVVRDGAELVGLDAGTGTERWRAEVGGDPTCGPALRSPGVPVADRIACWSGPNAKRSWVTVVDRNGLVATRDLPSDGALVAPGPGGTLVTVRRTGLEEGPAPDVEVVGDSNTGWLVRGAILSGRDAQVRVEDAETGAVLWEREVPFRPVEDANACVSWTYDGTAGEPTADVTTLSVLASTTFIDVIGCGLSTWFTLDGARMGDPDVASWSYLQPYPDGGVLEYVGADSLSTGVANILHGPDGATETFDQQVLVPLTTDGVPQAIRLVGQYPRSMSAIAPDGTELWRTTAQVTNVLARAGGVALVGLMSQALAAVDLATGETLWQDAGIFQNDTAPEPVVAEMLRAVFTDGERALVVTQAGDEPGLSLVALDLATGEVLWRDTQPDARTQYIASAGRLLAVGAAQSVEIRDEGGQLVRHADGVVRVYR